MGNEHNQVLREIRKGTRARVAKNKTNTRVLITMAIVRVWSKEQGAGISYFNI
jgi:hypothetical protein